MTTDQLIATYSPVGDFITVIMSLILLFVIAKVLFLSKGRRFNFLKRSLHFLLLASSCNIGFYHIVIHIGYAPIAIILVRDIYHISLLCCLYCYLLYAKRMLDIKSKFVKVVTYLTRTLFCLCLVGDVLSPITKVGISVSDGKWQDSLISPYNFFYVYTLFLLCGMLFLYSKRIIRFVRTCLIITGVAILFIMTCQILWNTNTYSGFTYLLPIMIVLITLHSRPFDVKTGSFSSTSFESFLKETKNKGNSVNYLVLKLYLEAGKQLPNELGKVLNSFWRDQFRDAMLFELSIDLYVLAIPRREKGKESDEQIVEFVNTHMPFYYEQYHLPYKIIELFDIDFVDNIEDILGITRYILNVAGENSISIVDRDKKAELQYFKKLKDQVKDIDFKKDLDDSRVLTYCQPIRNMKTGKFDTAEALIRLSLPDIGFVMPGLFVEMAEGYNYIHTLTLIMLNKICKQIKRMEQEGCRFEHISLNIPATEIKQESFCDEILEIIEKNGVSPSKIGIELTESQTERDFEIVKQRMEILHNAGMTLYLDDVGTGYSNLDRIVHYEVDVVKFDRFFLLEAEKSEKIVNMISHLSQAFKNLDYKILYEGVETETQEALCLKCEADYIQGFKYSKPIPIEELGKFFTPAEECNEK